MEKSAPHPALRATFSPRGGEKECTAGGGIVAGGDKECVAGSPGNVPTPPPMRVIPVFTYVMAY
jgi:hypothetical protein